MEVPEGADTNRNFLTPAFPMQTVLVSGEPYSKNKIDVWRNPRSSSRFCSPIRIQLVHETANVSKNEMKYNQNKISSLIATTVNVLVKHNLRKKN